MRTIELNNEQLTKLVEQKGELVKAGRKHYAKLSKLNDEANEIALENEEIKVQIRKIVGEEMQNIEMSEFETAGSTELKKGKVVVSIVDQVESFKENMRQQKEKAVRQESGEFTPEELIEAKQKEVLSKLQSVESKDLDGVLSQILTILK